MIQDDTSNIEHIMSECPFAQCNLTRMSQVVSLPMNRVFKGLDQIIPQLHLEKKLSQRLGCITIDVILQARNKKIQERRH